MTSIPVNARLFNKASRYFTSPTAALIEAVQNAYRANCPLAADGPKPIIKIDVADGNLTITDFGRGIDDVGVLLTPMRSDWAADVEHDQDPAGMGVCALIAFSKSVTWQSRFGTMTLDSARMMNDDAYVEQAVTGQLVDKTLSRLIGTTVTLTGFKLLESSRYRDEIESACHYYSGVDITLNGVPIAKAGRLGHELVARVGNNEVLLAHPCDVGGSDGRRFAVVWHGHLIGLSDADEREWKLREVGPYKVPLLPSSATVIIKDENCVTPQLPDRRNLKMDDRTVAFLRDASVAISDAVVSKIESVIATRAASSTCSYEVYEDEQRYFSYVEGYSAEYKSRCGFLVADTLVLRERNGRRYGVERRVYKRGAMKGLDLAEVVVISGGSDVTVLTPDSEPGGMVFGDDGDEDPLWDAGYVIDGDTDNQLYVLVDDLENVAITCSTSGYELWVAPRGLTTDIDVRNVGVEIDHGGNVLMICERDPTDGSAYDHLALFDSDCTVDSLVTTAERLYMDIYSSYQRLDDYENTAEGNIEAEDNEWTTFRLSLHGVTNISQMRPWSLRNKFGPVLTIDFNEKTVTVPDKDPIKVAF